MTPPERKALLALLPILAVGAAIAWAGSQGGLKVGGTPIFAMCAALSFAINGLVFVHAFLFRTERYFDLTGSLTYASLIAVALIAAGRADPRALLLGALVSVWAARLYRPARAKNRPKRRRRRKN